MRSAKHLTFLALWSTASAAAADIASMEDCQARLAAEPGAAQEEAARWVTLGGGTPARICEAYALSAVGATRTAATRMTELAQDRQATLDAEERALLLVEAGRLWLQLDQLDLARETYAAAYRLGLQGEYLGTLAELELAREEWAAALAILEGLDPTPNHDLLRAEALRGLGRLDEAETLLDSLPAFPVVELERAKLLFAKGESADALFALSRLRTLPGSEALAAEARALQDQIMALPLRVLPDDPEPSPLRPVRPRLRPQ